MRVPALACLGYTGLIIPNGPPKGMAALLKSFYSLIFVIAAIFPGFMVLMFLGTIADSWPRLSRSVFIMWESSEERSGNEKTFGYDVESPTFLCFTMFL